MTKGILLVSHSKDIGVGLYKLIRQVAKDVPISIASGTEEGEIGTSFDKISQAIDEIEADEIMAFFDLGSAKMNLEMAQEMNDKDITIYNTAFVEGAYNAAALLQVGADIKEIETQLDKLTLNK